MPRPPHDPHGAPKSRPSFLITIDTEGDNLWARNPVITTRNTWYLPRFQQLCERYGMKPTYLTNWEMAEDPGFVEFARDCLRRNTAEVGMHLHAWNSPPLIPLTQDDNRHHPYLIEYPQKQIREKVRVMTDKLEETFEAKMVSHRAGRWGFNAVYARILAELDYKVDCSVTPHYSWAPYKGDPNGAGGPDFTRFPDSAYFLDLDDIAQRGDSTLLEVPVTSLRPHYPPLVRFACAIIKRTHNLGFRAVRKFFPWSAQFVPDGRNRRILRALLAAARREERDYVEMAFHSSELMPGGSPTFPTTASVEKLYEDLEALFAAASRDFAGATLKEYYERFSEPRRHEGTKMDTKQTAREAVLSH
jgi:hypothetical protein